MLFLFTPDVLVLPTSTHLFSSSSAGHRDLDGDPQSGRDGEEAHTRGALHQEPHNEASLLCSAAAVPKVRHAPEELLQRGNAATPEG